MSEWRGAMETKHTFRRSKHTSATQDPFGSQSAFFHIHDIHDSHNSARDHHQMSSLTGTMPPRLDNDSHYLVTIQSPRIWQRALYAHTSSVA
ncbi:unnamed protein product [Prunus armeniaca]